MSAGAATGRLPDLRTRGRFQVAENTRITRRVVLLAGRAEAARLCRSPLVLAGLVISAWLIWLNNRGQEPLWWAADVGICSALLAMAGGVLITAHIAAGRSGRDAMTQLYESYPASAATRTGGLLLGVAGPVVLAAVLICAAAGWLVAQGAVGTPRLWVLAAGLLLVSLAGVLGVALASWMPHPMTGIMVALVLCAIEIDLVLSYDGPIHLPGGTAWLFPWSQSALVLNSLPGLTVPYPPPAHLTELAGLALLCCVAALWRQLPRRRVAALVAAAAVALTGWSGWSQRLAVPESTRALLVWQATHPAQTQRCSVLGKARYCYYPAFGPMVSRWAVPVDGVLGLLPRPPLRTLTVRQVDDADFLDYPLVPAQALTSNGPGPSGLAGTRLNQFRQALPAAPRLIPGSSVPPVYTDLSWGGGDSLGFEQLSLSIQAAWWVTGLPTTARMVFYSPNPNTSALAYVSCLPVGQAREAIALWLAASATPAARSVFLTGAAVGYGASRVGRTWVASYSAVPGVASSGYMPTVQYTQQGAALATAMLRLPGSRVESVLAARWPGWLRPQATDTELAAALQIGLPPARPAPASAISPAAPSEPVCH